MITHRIAVALLMGCYAICWFLWDRVRGADGADIDLPLMAARAVRLGLNPYDVIGPTHAFFPTENPLFYPLTAAIGVLPLSVLPLQVARIVFLGSSAALLAFVVTRSSWTPLVIFVSGAFVESARLAQWSIIMTASLGIPALGMLYACKPTIGAIVAAGQAKLPSRRVLAFVVAGWVVLLAGSFLAQPDWVPSWIAALRQSTQYRPLVSSPLGALVLLAAFRWRRPEARMLVAYALVPHLPIAYDALPAMTIGRTRVEYLTLAVGSLCSYAYQSIVISPGDPLMHDPRIVLSSLACIYLPALVMVLRRPNKA